MPPVRYAAILTKEPMGHVNYCSKPFQIMLLQAHSQRFCERDEMTEPLQPAKLY
jgi:hypothetical protein